jgi:hypothetical protein
MVNYQDGKIYKLVNTDNTLVYIGSTTHSIEERNKRHYLNYRQWKRGKYGYTTSFELFEDDEDGISIFLLELYPCNSSLELQARERYWIDKIDCVNMRKPTRTKKQYYLDNINKIKQYQSQAYICECGGKFSQCNRNNHMKTMIHKNYVQKIMIGFL